jgi:hypothetical protein
MVPLLLIAALFASLPLSENKFVACSQEPFRIWLDDYVFRKGETDIIKGIIKSNPTRYALSGISATKSKGTYGSDNMDKIDYLVTSREGGIRALKSIHLNSNHVISVTPGMDAITKKSGLAKALIEAFGSTLDLMPYTFPIPEGILMLRRYFSKEEARKNELWVLKENKHRGKGVTVVESKDVLPKLNGKYLASLRSGKKENPYGYVLAQQFVGEQMLIDGFPFTFRIWAVFASGPSTARAYVFDGSIIPFGDKKVPQESSVATKTRAEDLIVNLFLQDRDSAKDPWSMKELKEYLYKETGTHDAFNKIWKDVKRITARTLAAAIPNIRRETKKLKNTQQNTFEILGVDFVVDAERKPWLIEVNYLPSMARKVIGCLPRVEENNSRNATLCKESIFDNQKEKLITGILEILSTRHGISKNESFSLEVEHAFQNSQSQCSLSSKTLSEIMEIQYESQSAEKNGFSGITSDLYDSILCFGSTQAADCLEQQKSNYKASEPWGVIQGIKFIQQILLKIPLLDVMHMQSREVISQHFNPSNMDYIMQYLSKHERNSMNASILLESVCRMNL